MAVCKKIIYRGQVQGVGFRYTARRIASGLEVAGYVRNLSTGEVELVAEGEPDQVDALHARIIRQMTGCVAGAEVAEQPCQGFVGFEIRH